MSRHQDIKIPFSIGDRKYEAVGFLTDEEQGSSIGHAELLKRVPDACGQEEVQYIMGFRRAWPTSLRGYMVATGWQQGSSQQPYPLHRLAFLFWGDGGTNRVDLYKNWHNGTWGQEALALRRVQ